MNSSNPSNSTNPMVNILTIDLEDYFQVHAFSNVVKFEDWGNYKSRVEPNTHRLLEILNGSFRNPQSAFRNGVAATFFCLGWVAERYPRLIKEIKNRGHEIACHGYAHKLIYTQSEEEFREDIKKAKTILEDISGDEVIGYRAPSYSITEKSKWALEILMEEGFKYDSSIFPIHHDFYGFPQAPRFPFLISMNGDCNFKFQMWNFASQEHECSINSINPTNSMNPNNSATQSSVLSPQDSNFLPRTSNLPPPTKVNSSNPSNLSHEMGNLFHRDPSNSSNPNTPNSELRTPNCLLEFPLSTVRFCGQNFPISGGGYFRLFPYSLIKKGLKRINEDEGQPFIFYIHPWELDEEQPRIDSISMLSRFRHYVNLHKTEERLKKLISDFDFCSIKEVLELNRHNTLK